MSYNVNGTNIDNVKVTKVSDDRFLLDIPLPNEAVDSNMQTLKNKRDHLQAELDALNSLISKCEAAGCVLPS